MTYSLDLRKKALEYIEKGGSKMEASRIFGVSPPTIFNWIKRKNARNLAPSKTKKRRPYKIDRAKLKEYIDQNPDSYLREIAEVFGTSINAVFKACKELRITLKKNRSSTKKETKKKEKIFRKS
jgi:transposase